MNTRGVSRRTVLTTAAAGGLVVGMGAVSAQPAVAASSRPARRVPVVLVHGALNDASSWAGVVARLQAAGHEVTAVQLPLLSLPGDVEVVRRAVDAASRPVILAGHSYGGAVISGASGVSTNVAALVYCAATGVDEGESCNSVGSPYPPTEAAQVVNVDAFGFITATPSGFVNVFASDVDRAEAWVRAVSQKPAFAGIFSEISGPVGWHRLPCYYQISSNDKVMWPQAQQDTATRLHAHTITLPASHLSPVSRAHEISQLIRDAAREHG